MFRNTRAGVSVDDGEFSSAEETYERNKHCGVAAISKGKLAERGLKLELDPEDTTEDLKLNPAHRVVMGVTAKDAKRITESAEIVIRLEGWQVRGSNGTMGQKIAPITVAAPAQKAPAETAREDKAVDDQTLPLFPDDSPDKT